MKTIGKISQEGMKSKQNSAILPLSLQEFLHRRFTGTALRGFEPVTAL
jgi:hypothetical protein